MTTLDQATGPEFSSGRLALKPRNLTHFRRALIRWFTPQQTAHPWRQERHGRRDPYRVWVSEIMLQQTTIAAVTPKYIKFIEALPSVDALARASEPTLRPLVQGLGYYRRFNLLHKAAKQLVAERRASRQPTLWPTTYTAWRQLPGVGDYTAAAVSSFAFDEQKVALDGNGERILQRLLASEQPLDTKGKAALKRFADGLLGSASAKIFNEALMELGQKICIRKVPRCSQCPISRYCEAYGTGKHNAIPVAVPRRKPVSVGLTMLVPLLRTPAIAKDIHVGLRQRSSTAKFLKGTLGFATCIEAVGDLKIGGGHLKVDGDEVGKASLDKALAKLSARSARSTAIGSFKHAITHHKLEVQVRLVEVRSAATYESAGFRFVPLSQLGTELTASLDSKTAQKIIRHISQQEEQAEAESKERKTHD